MAKPRMWSGQLSPKDEKKAREPRLPEPEPIEDMSQTESPEGPRE